MGSICGDQGPDVAHHFCSTNGRLLQEMQFKHTANCDANLRQLIARLPLSSGAQLLEHTACCELRLQFPKLFNWDLVTWQTTHVLMFSLAAFGYGEISFLLCLSAYSFSLVWQRSLTTVIAKDFTVALQRRPLPSILGEQRVLKEVLLLSLPICRSRFGIWVSFY